MPHMYLADAWWTSGTFWAAAGVFVALAVGIAAAAVAWVVGVPPKRRMMYGMPLAAPMLVAPQGVRGELELRHRGVPLDAPHVVELKLVNRGRRDIPTSAFDNGTPITLDTGAKIIELLQTTSDPSTIPAPEVTVAGTALKVGPGLIGRRQRITYTVLVDGTLDLKYQGTLQDVDVRQLSDDEAVSRTPLIYATAMTAITMGALVASLGSSTAADWTWTVAAGAGIAGILVVSAGTVLGELAQRSRARR
jgi:hypothetical protein